MFTSQALKFLTAASILITATTGAVGPAEADSTSSPPDPIPVVPGNLLINPGFEEPYAKQCCHTDPQFPGNQPIDEVQVPVGWRAWWREPAFPDYPPRCDDAQAPKVNCVAFHRPEWRDAASGGTAFDAFRYRIHSGLNAQKYFTFDSVHEAGMYQQVSNGIQPGQELQFSIYLQTWSTNSQDLMSTGQQTMNLKVGIDPFGGTDPFSANIQWSQPSDSYDTYRQFTLEAMAQRNSVTVFTYSRPVYPLQHNDVYVDDAALVVIGAGAVPVAPTVSPPVTAADGNSDTSFRGTTADTSGDIIYVVRPGDTLFSIALRYRTTIRQLMAWNNLYSSTFVEAWKALIVGKGSASTAPAEGAVEQPTAATQPAASTRTSPFPGTALDSYGRIICVVQPFDSIGGLALRFGTTVRQIMIWNNLRSADDIQVGEILIVGWVGN